MHHILRKAATTRWIRRIALPIFERFNLGDVRIHHHYTQRRLLLHSYRHKGYWFHGQHREQATMRFFKHVLSAGETVIEVGGHIGYLTMWFAELVGPTGQVKVFEPGENNLRYLRENIRDMPNVELLEFAVADADGTARFFEEGLTGQNNSLLGDYQRFGSNRRFAYSRQEYRERSVRTIRLDTFLSKLSWQTSLVKIDIEGAEFLALAGATKLLAEQRPVLMVEITERAGEVTDLLRGHGYELFTPEGTRLAPGENIDGNVCALDPEHHASRLARWREKLANACI